MKVNKQRKRICVIITIITVVVAMFGIVCAMYLGDYYRADMEQIESFKTEQEVEVKIIEDDIMVWNPEQATTGFIFYPGGKVEHTSYIPLMEALASEGVLCVLVEMPFHLAVFDINAADGIQEEFPRIRNWYIGGHSLGGSMAATYLENHIDTFDGLVLLGSYVTAELGDADLKVLSVYGSEDLVLNKQKYEENKANLPMNFEEVMIEGGCHAYFGMYGEQEGDGKPRITPQEQIDKTVEAIITFYND